MKLPEEWYQRSDVVQVARDLLGKVLVTQQGRQRTSGMIVETEAYAGITDRASHAYGGRRTARTEVMYARGGVAYVYLCYGIHHLFNVVTHTEGIPHAVLIRAIEPLEGIETMLRRRKHQKVSRQLTAGPGTLSQALQITTTLSGQSLQSDHIWIEDQGIAFSKTQVFADMRIGVDYAGDDAKLPYRFGIKDNLWLSKQPVRLYDGTTRNEV